MEPLRYHRGGAVVPWCRGAVVPWCRGAVVPWCRDAVVESNPVVPSLNRRGAVVAIERARLETKTGVMCTTSQYKLCLRIRNAICILT